MRRQLAIIIPAYKQDYLGETLTSIFSMKLVEESHVYIFDDASPWDIESVVSSYRNLPNVTYFRFSQNMGGSNLAEHWNRCIKRTKEDWIWLFSDDDLVSIDCLDSFFNELNADKDSSHLYRFNTHMISASSSLIRKNPKHKLIESSEDYIRDKILGKRLGFVTEFIFSRDIFLESEGFVAFNKAWNSDDATWLKMGRFSSLKLLERGIVSWRLSNANISSVKAGDAHELMEATSDYIRWIYDNEYFEEEERDFLCKVLVVRQCIYLWNFSLEALSKVLKYWGLFWRRDFISIILMLFLVVKQKILSRCM